MVLGGGEWVGSLGQGLGGWGGVMYVCVYCESGLFVLMAGLGVYIVLDEYLRILGVPSVQCCCTLSISAS